MSRSRNAEDFRQKYLKIRSNYEDKYRGQIERVRAMYEHSEAAVARSHANELLEVHFREYFVNSLLHALNWRLNISPDEELPNLIPESPVASVSRGTKRRLDYLGIEQETLRPLLIVETKHPGSPLPELKKPSNRQTHEQSVIDSSPSIIADELHGHELMGKWNEWLKDLRDYVLDVQDKSEAIPKRVVLTDGRWLILFTDPADSFLPSGSRDPNRIFALIYEDDGNRKRDDFADRYNEIFDLLEHQRVLGETPTLTISELRFHLSAEEVAGAMHGLRLMYIEKPCPCGVASQVRKLYAPCHVAARTRMPSPLGRMDFRRVIGFDSAGGVSLTAPIMNFLARSSIPAKIRSAQRISD